MIAVVVKPFEAEGRVLAAGTIVDSSAWRNEGRLINCRWLREATESEVADFKKNPTPARPTANTTTAKAAKPNAVKKKKAKTAAAPKTSSAPADTEHVHSI